MKKMTAEVVRAVVAQEKKIMTRIRLTVVVRHNNSSIGLYQHCEHVHFIEQGHFVSQTYCRHSVRLSSYSIIKSLPRSFYKLRPQ